ncbi:MAG: PRD domain-containing protein [Selenomonas sp.]|nr:PRD domain-containing protein [Selenomonas sp.]
MLGKGIGYGRKAREELSVDENCKTFIPVAGDREKQIVELLNSLPPEIMDVTHKIVDMAERELETSLNKSIYFTLADHINFAIERLQKKLVITNRSLWGIKSFYSKEFAVAEKCLACLNETLKVNLPEEEAANIAFHIANAEEAHGQDYDSARNAKLMGEIVNIVCYSLHKKLDKESLHYNRFITHIRFFVERFFTNQMLTDDILPESIAGKYKTEEVVAEKIRQHLLNRYEKEISEEEKAYLIIHISRLARS